MATPIHDSKDSGCEPEDELRRDRENRRKPDDAPLRNGNHEKVVERVRKPVQCDDVNDARS